MSGTIGSTPTTEIISEGLVFNVDARLRASVLKPLGNPMHVHNTVAENTFDEGVCKMSGMTSLESGGTISFSYINSGPTNNNWVLFDGMTTLNLSRNHSAEFVIYNKNIFGPTSWPAIYNRGGQSGSNGYWWCFLTDGGGVDNLIWQYSYAPSSYASLSVPTVINRFGYTHGIISINYDTFEYKVYINGALVSTQTPDVTIREVPGQDNLYMGVYNGSSGSQYGFTGDIPILRFYDRVLNEDEVTHNFTAIKNYYAL